MEREEPRYCEHCRESLDFDEEYIFYDGMWFCSTDCLANYLLEHSEEEERELAKKYLIDNTDYEYHINYSEKGWAFRNE